MYIFKIEYFRKFIFKEETMRSFIQIHIFAAGTRKFCKDEIKNDRIVFYI